MKTNIKYILIVIILAVVVGGGILMYQYWWAPKEEVDVFGTKMPEEVRERMQGNIQEELEKGEILQSSKSTRTICMEMGGGGPSEMCEKIPLQGFESFESYRTFCAEVGGIPEMCASFEPTCKEFGLTEADKCFRVFSTPETWNSD